MTNPYEPPQTSPDKPTPAVPPISDFDAATEHNRPSRSLSLFDSTSIIVGVIIGATIYQSHQIARVTASLPILIGVWLAGGAAALIGALCYAELATTYPRDGG